MPIGAPAGPLYFTVADATTTNLADFRQILTASPRTAAQLIATVNSLHPNTKAYVRVWRADPAFQLEGADLPAPPPRRPSSWAPRNSARQASRRPAIPRWRKWRSTRGDVRGHRLQDHPGGSKGMTVSPRQFASAFG